MQYVLSHLAVEHYFILLDENENEKKAAYKGANKREGL